jgi:hypothetical protein
LGIRPKWRQSPEMRACSNEIAKKIGKYSRQSAQLSCIRALANPAPG